MSTDLERLKIKKPTPKANSRDAVDGVDGGVETIVVPVRPLIPDEALPLNPVHPIAIRILKPVTLIVDGLRNRFGARDILRVADYGPRQFASIIEQLDDGSKDSYETVV